VAQHRKRGDPKQGGKPHPPRWRAPIPIFTIALISSIAYVGVRVIIPLAAELNNWSATVRWMHYGASALIVTNILFNFLGALLVDAGHPEAVEFSHCDAAKSFCPKCSYAKPFRAHHCSALNRCVLRLDHFCSFTNNAVGHRNYGYFYLFLFWVTAGGEWVVGLGRRSRGKNRCF
jgi:hypothetical protein